MSKSGNGSCSSIEMNALDYGSWYVECFHDVKESTAKEDVYLWLAGLSPSFAARWTPERNARTEKPSG